MVEENKQVHVTNPFYVFQKFTTFDELKDKIRLYVIETIREVEITMNKKNRVRDIV